MTRKQLHRASYHLRLHAKALRQSNTIRGRWTTALADERADYEEMMQLASELQALARDPDQTIE